MKAYKTTEELIKENDNFINSIPNKLGINLCSVDGIEYDRKKDGQLKTIKIVFKPE